MIDQDALDPPPREAVAASDGELELRTIVARLALIVADMPCASRRQSVAAYELAARAEKLAVRP